jgi:hypothetical protein
MTKEKPLFGLESKSYRQVHLIISSEFAEEYNSSFKPASELRAEANVLIEAHQKMLAQVRV